MMMIVIETAMCLTVACLFILIPKVISAFKVCIYRLFADCGPLYAL